MSGTDRVAVTPFAVDPGPGMFGDGIVANHGHGALGCEARQHGGEVPTCQTRQDQRRWEKMW